MSIIHYLNRSTGNIEKEEIYGETLVKLLYIYKGTSWLRRLIAKTPLFSKLVGWWKRTSFSKRQIVPFIKKYQLNTQEFACPVDAFSSFDAFFTRKLKPEARPIGKDIICPADGRYLFHQNISECTDFVIKGGKFSLTTLIGNTNLTEKYRQGSMVIVRLCPTDYHRFHFPMDGTPGPARAINGPLYSVNPLALWQRPSILAENKRVITELETTIGTVLMIEVGATCVGTIHQTFSPNHFVQKGEEKGYFSFGGSSMILLFPKNTIKIHQDLLDTTLKGLETLCLYGEKMAEYI